MIDLEPFRAALAASPVRCDEGMTSAEIAAAMGCGINTVRKMLDEAHRQGRLISGKRIERTHFSGKAVHFTVYKWREE